MSGQRRNDDTFDYHLYGTHVRFGDGVAAGLRAELDALDCRRPLILTQDRIAATPRYHALAAQWRDLAHLELAGVPPHSHAGLVADLATRARDFGPDCVIGIGGGSVADSAKALVLLLAEGGELADHVTRYQPPRGMYIPRRVNPQLPIVALPTTASGAEATCSFGVADGHGQKLMFWNRRVSASTLLVDPELAEDVPLALLHQSAMNGIAHCLEGLYSTGRSPVSDALALQALGLFQQAMEHGAAVEISAGISAETSVGISAEISAEISAASPVFALAAEAGAGQRRSILAAAHLGGMVLAMARSCLHHAICHVVATRYRLGHGAVNSVVLPHAIAYNEADPAVAARLAPALDAVNRALTPPRAAGATPYASLSAWLLALQRRHALPMHLRDLGVPADDLPALAERVMTERGLALNPRSVAHPADVLAILHAAF
ncbi:MULTISPECIES: iron-containing alcohol dehydrogenase family protein [unclassified Achromobacter]|uniref:iron-containing alcohol dehydrogenase family protein n=1 Tax=unclassified Achromobacter TaxID=2626865 RepID=UPI000B515646|nr:MULTISPECIES: iron-containing alcohol dehydrogenase [unclassified Achromobacter]OWT69093.1 iron-containing alcohol dehydrogenase [Achromobacter sp. HZ34]OWT70498.1 iron-containing alcohol dehydrogenase [Achromobacter sp. HZ28]